MQTEGNKTLVYLYASTSGYGFRDGVFVPVLYWNSDFCGSNYVEAAVNGKTWRGFVLQSTVQK